MDKIWHHGGYLSSRMLSVIEQEFLVRLALGHWFSVAPGRKGLWRRPVRAEEVFDCNSTDRWDDSARQNLADDWAHNLVPHLPSFLPSVLTASPGFGVATSNWNRIARIVLEAHRNLTTKCTPCRWSCLVTKWIPLQMDRRLLPSSSGLCHQPASRVPAASFIETGIVGYMAAPGVLLVLILTFSWTFLNWERALLMEKCSPGGKWGWVTLSACCSILAIKGWFREKEMAGALVRTAQRLKRVNRLRLVSCGSWPRLALLDGHGWGKS